MTGGIKAAVEQARAVAGGQDVLLAGGVSVAQQALAAGLVDEVVLHVVPVLLGRGMRLFGAAQVDLRVHRDHPRRGRGPPALRGPVTAPRRVWPSRCPQRSCWRARSGYRNPYTRRAVWPKIAIRRRR